jgi:hypothetical protein
MSQSEVVTLSVRGAWGEGIEIAISSAAGMGADPNLTLSVRPRSFGGAEEGETQTRALEPNEAAELWRLLDEFELRGTRSDTVGLDGVTYSLAIDASQLRVSVEWWQRPPEGWVGPRRLCDELLRLAGSSGEPYRR